MPPKSTTSSSKLNRRTFIRTTATALAAAPFLHPFRARATTAPLLTAVHSPGQLHLAWTGGQPPWVLEETAALGPLADWQPVVTLANHNYHTLATDKPARYFRVRSHAGPYQSGTPANWDFQTGDFTGWTVTPGTGNAVVLPHVDRPGNFAAQLTVGDPAGPVRLTIDATTPDDFFYLIFDTRFLTTGGTLTVSVFDPAANGNLGGETTVAQLTVTAADTALRTNTIVVDKNLLKNLPNAQLRFTLTGAAGDQLQLDNLAILPGAAAEECTYVGDPIGNDNTSTTGTGAYPAMQGVQGTTQEDPYNWDNIVGESGILYVSDGKSLLKNFRSIVTVLQNGPANPGWSDFNWNISILTEAAYLSKGTPIKDVYLGYPDNWQGYTVEPGVGVFPTHQFWSYPLTSQPTAKAWELKWDLSQYATLREALPVGRYILVFKGSSNASTNGFSAVVRTYSGNAPEPYYARTLLNVADQYQPAKAIPTLNADPNFRWAMHLTEEKLNCD